MKAKEYILFQKILKEAVKDAIDIYEAQTGNKEMRELIAERVYSLINKRITEHFNFDS